jgi:hypothetical protein
MLFKAQRAEFSKERIIDIEDCREKASFSLWFYHEYFTCICIVFGYILKSERTDLLRYAIEFLQRERNAVEK